MNDIKLSKLWDALLTSYWFLPGMLAITAVILAFTMLHLDRTIVTTHKKCPHLRA
ncbi:hypothetical protein NWP17_12575 [Chrysosporum bergii ANA360D]|uniref:Uncharacterized protein n=1 Tax=Chrysosporum bergii ANA360D TaxID=617107 RepID=A0AA43GTU9_9CYAN|nr:hypothetical protein [Chrysosporum bergii]MDH6061261.1 hypothetical protein [Chrysosporum bergii ANA360D]